MPMKRSLGEGSRRKVWTYAEAGVDLSRVRDSHKIVAEILGQTFHLRSRGLGSVLGEIGHYAGLIDIGGGKALALHVDGVGSKILIAQMMNRFDTVGIDCVAMNVNDLICVGAEPLTLVDYLAVKELHIDVVKEIAEGLAKGGEEAEITIVGGETAVLPDMIVGEDYRAFDLAGMSVGIVDKSKIIDGSGLRSEDIIVGVESSGIHSNGLSLARRVLLKKYGIEDCPKGLSKTLGEELLTPTRIYVKPVLEILQSDIEVTGLAHITGGAFSKLNRLAERSKIGFNLNEMPKPQKIFQLIQKEGNISNREMYRTFNMGIGFCIFTKRSEVEKIVEVFERYQIKVYKIGSVTDSSGVYVKNIRID